MLKKSNERFINEDGDVGVIYSSGYGSGFNFVCDDGGEQIRTDYKLVPLIIEYKNLLETVCESTYNCRYDELAELSKIKKVDDIKYNFLSRLKFLCKEAFESFTYPTNSKYNTLYRMANLDVEFVCVDGIYKIEEYDGQETIRYAGPREDFIIP